MRPTRLAPLDARIPAWDPAQMRPRSCPICRADVTDEAVERPDQLTVVRCSNCRTYYVSPAPSAAALDAFYAGYLTHATGSSDISDAPPLKRVARDDVRIQTLLSKMDLRGARVLDIGCGTGYLLEMLGEVGAKASGIDVDPASVERARKRGLDVRRATIVDVPTSPAFDLVVLNDVIEHPLEPMPMLRDALARIRVGGLLALWTPNGDAADTDDEKITFRVDLEHMQYLGAESMRWIASELQLQVVHYESLGYPNVAPIVSTSRRRRMFRDILRRLPAFQVMNRLRVIYQNGSSVRRGNYHLFCVYRRIN